MQMSGQQRISAPILVVWQALNDAEVLKASIPGCQALDLIGENRFQAAATIKVGPIGARFGGVVQLSELDPPRSYRISGEGSGGAAGGAKGGARVWLEEDGDHTMLHYEASADVSGRLAQLGGKLIDVTAKQLAGVFFTRFAEQVSQFQAQPAAAPATASATAPVAASPSVAAPAAQRVAPPVAPYPAPQEQPRSGSLAWLLIAAAALVGGFVLGRSAEGWDGSGALPGLALGLLVVLVAAAAFLLGRDAHRPPATVSLDPATAALLSSLTRDRQS